MNKVEVATVLSTYDVVKNVDVTVWYNVVVALTKELHRFSNGRKKNKVGSGSTSIDDPWWAKRFSSCNDDWVII